jgi:hypothetical protein
MYRMGRMEKALGGFWFHPVILYILSMISHSLNRVMP